ADGFDAAFRASASARELHRVRNIAPGFKKGLWLGLANAALETATGGRTPWTLKGWAPDWQQMEKRAHAGEIPQALGPRELPPKDRLASVYFAATSHDENQPPHLKV